MSNEVCKCGHSQQRHAFGVAWCTHSERGIGASWIACHCSKFEPKMPESVAKSETEA
jgi:hypothetical protein